MAIDGVGWLRRARRVTESPSAIARVFCTLVLALTLGGIIAHSLAHQLQVLRTSTPGTAYPLSIYGLLAVPGTRETPGTPGAAGADFSQVYTSGLALRHGESAYTPKSRKFKDKFGRRSGYPPPMNWLYVPLTYLPYGQALLVHSFGTFAALLGVSALVLWRMQLQRHIAVVLSAQSALLWLTPIGFTHLERGQHDIVMGLSAALAVACSFWPKGAYGPGLVSGLLGSLKWTALSFLGCFSALAFLTGTGLKRWLFLAIPLVTVLVTACFHEGVLEYWQTIRIYELEAQPFGLTLQYFLPRVPAKLVPVLATLLLAGIVWLRRETRTQRDAAFRAIAVPFAIALMNLAICFGTLSYEYHTVATVAMIPCLVVWIETEQRASNAVKLVAALGYAPFLAVAFRPYDEFIQLSPPTMTGVFVACAALFLLLCATVLFTFGKKQPSPVA